MNPAYAHARFRAELPHGALPAVFGVVTAWNTDGREAKPVENEAATARLLSAIGQRPSSRTQCDTGGTVMSGFHSPMERDVFAILARRGANLILVPGRDIPKTVPAPERTLLDEGRLLIASPFDYGHPSRPSRESCLRRNEWIACRASTITYTPVPNQATP